MSDQNHCAKTIPIAEIMIEARRACSGMDLGQDRNDFVQEAALKIWKRRGCIDPDRSPPEQRRYMRRIARRAILDALRQKKLRKDRFLPTSVPHVLTETTPEDHLVAADMLRAAMGVELSAGEELAIANLLGTGVSGDNRQALHHARKKLRQAFS